MSDSFTEDLDAPSPSIFERLAQCMAQTADDDSWDQPDMFSEVWPVLGKAYGLVNECQVRDDYDSRRDFLRRIGAKSDTEDLWLLEAMLDATLEAAAENVLRFTGPNVFRLPDDVAVGERLIDRMPALRGARGPL